MRFSENWLRELTNPDLTSEQLVEQLTMGGLEVDVVEPVAGEFSGVVVARIEQCTPHPDADKLRLCQVNDGSGEPLQIVCGAPNAREGLVAPVARVGAVLPGDFKIKKAKLRGVESFGMLCSGKELGLGDDHDGLMALPAEAVPGDDLREYLRLDDQSIEIDLTPNRADCLGLVGIARDVSALTGSTLTESATSEVTSTIDDTFPVELIDAVDCPRYVGRVIRSIDATAGTPLWMQEKLRRSGLRSLSPVVDVTNFVLLELGQPMHAFDLDKLDGGIKVRRASAGDTITLLDDSVPKLSDELLICDHAGPVAIGGIMGGLTSSVTDATENLFLESAWFRPQTIAGRARELGMHTDASHRYERGVDPELQVLAMERATALLLEIVGGQAGPLVETCSEQHLPQRQLVPLRSAQIERVLGINLNPDEVEKILTGLAMQVEQDSLGWQVTAPSRRFDISSEIDLIEEVARVYGYNRLPTRAPQGAIPAPSLPEEQTEIGRLRSTLIERGYHEVINYSFVSPSMLAPMGSAETAVPLSNPLSADMALMRTSLLPGLLASLDYNLKRQHERVRLFESGVVFPNSENEELRLAGVIVGNVSREHWDGKPAAVDFFDVKAHVEALVTSIEGELSYRRSERATLHPGQSAEIFRGDQAVGWVGALHPSWLKQVDLTDPVFGFELSLPAIMQRSVPKFAKISKFPSIRFDLAMEFPKQILWSQVCEIVEENAGNLLTRLVVFDEYTGQGISSGKKSLAFGLVLQDPEATLTDDQAETIKNNVIAGLSESFGAVLRG